MRLTSKEKVKLGDYFSIVEQTTNKATLLFLSLVCFRNYDYIANTELILISYTNIEVRASCNILISKEITILYSDYYFNNRNFNCLCRTYKYF